MAKHIKHQVDTEQDHSICKSAYGIGGIYPLDEKMNPRMIGYRIKKQLWFMFHSCLDLSLNNTIIVIKKDPLDREKKQH